MLKTLHTALTRSRRQAAAPFGANQPSAADEPRFQPRELERTPMPRLRVLLLGTCVSENLATTADPADWDVQHWLMDFGEAPPLPPVSAQGCDIVVVHLTLRTLLGRVQPWGDGDLFHCREGEPAELAAAAGTLLETFTTQLLARLPVDVPVVFLACAEPPAQGNGLLPGAFPETMPALVRGLNERLATLLRGYDHAFYAEINDLLRFQGSARSYDGYFVHASHAGVLPDVPEGRRFYRDVWERIGALWRVWHKLDPVKLIITDLDDTLWHGVAAEADEIVPLQFVEGRPLGYAEALLACKRRGLLLAIASKNDEAVTRERFHKIWGERLRLDDFCCVKIGWRPKPEAVREILAETNILSKHALFIDDSPLEIAEIRHELPELRTLTLPAERWRHVLFYAPETQIRHISSESQRRTEMIHAKLARDAAGAQMDRGSFLRSLKLRLKLREIRDRADPAFPRALELLNKTNQFNTTGQRWQAAEIEACFKAGGWLLTANATDRFADHGLIGLMLVRGDEILQAVLSCRMFGLGVETAMLCAVQERLAARGMAALKAHWRDTSRNHSCAGFYTGHGWQPGAAGEGWLRSGAPPDWPDWIEEL